MYVYLSMTRERSTLRVSEADVPFYLFIYLIIIIISNGTCARTHHYLPLF